MMTKTIIGLTGGIASGKSTVSTYLREQGYPVLDADQLVHDLQTKGGRLYEALLAQFGPAILAADGQLDRPKLAELIFSSSENLELSNQLQDQIIREELAEEKDRLLAQADLIFLDIPLLFEKGYENWCDQVWLVMVDETTQLKRLMARNGYSLEEAQKRVASQLPLADKLQRADRVIDNNGSLETTYEQVQKMLDELKIF